ncbi:MAG TPA: hypothetical protein DIW44_12310 [Anaerolineaceae bacterium]|nr:hypothetical protein [Anaerolineaceae bacterium]
MKRFAIILVVLLFTLACAPLEVAKSTMDVITSSIPVSTSSPEPTTASTSTSTAAPTATLDAVKQSILYKDDFSEDSGSWTPPDDGESRFYISDGEYFVQVVKSDYSFYNLSFAAYGNFVLSVDLRHIIGDDETTGGMVIWRYKDNDNFYALTVMDNGTYYIHRFVKGTYGMLKLPTASPWLNTTGKPNTVTLVAHGDTNELYFNGHYEYSFQDASIPKGYFGMGAQPALDSEVEVAFDNLNVYQYDPGNGFTPDNPEITPTPEYQNISWQQLTRFLSEDHTNWHEYHLEDYNCMDFAIDLVANARYANISAKIVTVQFVGQPTGHAFVAFETLDRGTVFVEPQGDNTYSNVDIGNNLCDDWGEFECMGTIESVEYFGECDHAQNCTVLP